MTINEFIARLGDRARVRKAGSGWMARCPAHEDHDPSLQISEGTDGRVLLHCYAGCTAEGICSAMGLKLADLFPTRPKLNGMRRQIIATYDYRDKKGKLRFQVCRYEPKVFRQRQPDELAPDGWRWDLEGVQTVPFRLPELLDGVQKGLPILISEGEKDVLALVEHGFTATCNPMGAGKWRKHFNADLKGADCIILADKDEPGRMHAAQVANSLHGTAGRIRVIEVPDVNGTACKDPAGFFAAGGNAEELVALIDSSPDWAPPMPSAQTVVVSGNEYEKITSDLRGSIVGVLAGQGTMACKRAEVARLVVCALAKIGHFYFHADQKDFDSATFFNSETKLLERIRSDSFLARLSNWIGVNRADAVFRYVIAQVETAALSGGYTTGILPESYWAARPGAIFISNGDGQAVRITATGIELVDNGTDGVLFSAGRTLAPWNLVTPQDPFSTCSIFRDIRIAAPHASELVRLWVYSLPTAPPSKPPLCLVGPVGSGKTRLAKGIAEFYGVPFVASKVEQQGERDFWPSLDAGGLLTLDNADTRCPWLPDSISAAATDGCSERRKLYTNAEVVKLRPRAWLCVTTAAPTFANDAGLADRLIVVRMNRRENETADERLTQEIRAARDAGLSYVAAILRKALADGGRTPLGVNARHPDFAAFAVKIGRALGREAQAIGALSSAETDKSRFCLENDPIGAAILAIMEKRGFCKGSAAELIQEFKEADPDFGIAQLSGSSEWSPKRVGKRLTLIWSHVRAMFPGSSMQKDRCGSMIYYLKRSNQ